MLGSQPTREIVLESVKSMLEVVKEKNLTDTIHFFVFCGKDPQDPNKKGADFPTLNYLLTEVCQASENRPGLNIPPH